MDVKDVTNSKVVSSTQLKSSDSLRQNPQSLAAKNVPEAGGLKESVALHVEPNTRGDKPELRAKANSVINVINVATEATSEIEKLIQSVDGIVEQADAKEISDQRLGALEKEANELIAEIEAKTANTSADGINPFSGDPIKLEIQEELGKTLEIVFPDAAKDSFGLSKVDFSEKNNIVSTRVTIESAQREIEKLRQSLEETKATVASTVSAVDVAIQNSEAAGTSIRELEEAIKMADKMQLGIPKNPDGALNSIGDINKTALSLLK